MGFFKKIGSSLKRVVSLKNVVRGVTGQFGAIAQDAVRIATTDAPSKNVENELPVPVQNPVIPQPILQALDGQGAKFSSDLTAKIAKTDTAQDATSFLAKVGLEAMYQKYKTWITVGFLALLGFILYRVLRRDHNNTGARVAKKR